MIPSVETLTHPKCNNCDALEDVCRKHPRAGYCRCLAETPESQSYDKQHELIKDACEAGRDLSEAGCYILALNDVLIHHPVLREAAKEIAQRTMVIVKNAREATGKK